MCASSIRLTLPVYKQQAWLYLFIDCRADCTCLSTAGLTVLCSLQQHFQYATLAYASCSTPLGRNPASLADLLQQQPGKGPQDSPALQHPLPALNWTSAEPGLVEITGLTTYNSHKKENIPLTPHSGKINCLPYLRISPLLSILAACHVAVGVACEKDVYVYLHTNQPDQTHQRGSSEDQKNWQKI